MSTLVDAATVSTPSTAVRRRVTWRDHVWLTWHRQGGSVLAVSFAVLVLVALLVHAEHVLTSGPTGLEARREARRNGDVLLRAVSFLPLVIGLFWGVPTVAREIEGRTATLAWSQDVSPGRWLVGRLVVLGAATVALSSVVSWFAARLGRALHEPPPVLVEGRWVVSPASGFESEFGPRLFEVLAPMTVVYSVTGLLVGVAVGALVKQVLPAIAVVTVGLVGLRLAVAHLWRPRFQEPERLLQAASNDHRSGTLVDPPSDSLVLGDGWADRTGAATEPYACDNLGLGGRKWWRCIEENGLQAFTDYQPPDRIVPFQLIETGIFVTVGVAALVLATALLRGRRVWV